MDKRKHYVIVLDTETANTNVDGKLDATQCLVYDMGWAVVDTKGEVYEERSYINSDIFIENFDLMQSAYYAKKIPAYIVDLAKGSRQLETYEGIRRAFLADMKKYGITEVVAHNARFDCSSLNATTRYLTKSQQRYFFPYGTEVWDTMAMARDVICKTPSYKRFCEENGYMTANNQVRKTAEILFRFISGDNEFIESHTGLEDVKIEAQIFHYCYRQHKPMRKVLYAKPDRPEDTEIQKRIMRKIKYGD